MRVFTWNQMEPEVEDNDVEVVPMSDEDFEDEIENRNEFEQPTFTSEWWVPGFKNVVSDLLGLSEINRISKMSTIETAMGT